MSICTCGHTHKEWVGDLGENQDEEGWDIVLECSKCDCESYHEVSE